MKLIDKLLTQSAKPWYSWLVFVMTVLESIFLFIPPEVFMTPAIVADKKRTVPMIISTSLGSFIGGAITFLIGYLVFDTVGVWLIEHISSMEQFTITQTLFNKYGILIIILTAVTPIPYKLLALCAGFLHFNIFIFLGVSALFRTGRFTLVGLLLYKFQKQANYIVKKYSWQLTIGAIILACLGFFILTYIN